MSEQQIDAEIIETAQDFARDFVFHSASSIPEDPEFTAVVIRWQEFKNTLTARDRNMAVQAFREVLGEERSEEEHDSSSTVRYRTDYDPRSGSFRRS